MDCYIIPPLTANDLMNEGDRFFALAHLYVKPENEAYRQFFKDKLKEGKWVTLDNGAAEASLVTEDILIEAVKDLMPSEVIAPDVLFDYQRTMLNLDLFINRMDNEKLLDKVEIFYAPQGNDIEEWLKCYKHGLGQPYVKTIGMSKISVPHAWYGAEPFSDTFIPEARYTAVRYLIKKGLLRKPLHFLGAGSPDEFKEYREFKDHLQFFRSTDSCFTVWAAMNGVDFSKGDYTRIKTPHDYFEREISVENRNLARKNIQVLRFYL